MNKYFNIYIEFNHTTFYSIIEESIRVERPGYVCIIDGNVLTISQTNPIYLNVLNEAIVNTCDGSSIAMMAGIIHKQKYRALNGPEIFNNYIEKNYKQLLLGGTVSISNRIKAQLKQKGIDSDNILILPLPFLKIDDFDFERIAYEINLIKPDIIWVSLGAPKQEIFMNRILPFLDKGVMFGIGAAFNFYVGDLKMTTFQLGGLKFIWLNRLINEPKKLTKRIIPYLLTIPFLFLNELKRKKRPNQNI